jgi:glycosyltransferase involved in cell wall biosynthesis
LKKKILFILHLPPPIHGATLVGQFIQQSTLINDNFECEYINLTTSKQLSNIGRVGYRKLLTCLKLYIKVFFTIIKKRHDLYYLTINSKGNGFYKDFVIVILIKIFGYKVVYHYHNKGITEGQDNWLLNLMYRFQFKNSRVILLSPLLYWDVAKYLPKEKVYYCANGIPEISGINLYLINSKRAAKAIPEMLFLSNMLKEKGVFTLLKACKLLYSKGIKFKMIFIGEWIDINESDFNEFVIANGLQENVYYEGKKFGEEKSVYLERADIFIHPTLNDCFPLAILEAMQYGLPVISTFEGGIPDIVSENETGYLVKKQDVKELADKLQYLIENPDVRRKMGIAAKIKFEELFRIDIFENNLIRILKIVIKRNNFKISSTQLRK